MARNDNVAELPMDEAAIVAHMGTTPRAKVNIKALARMSTDGLSERQLERMAKRLCPPEPSISQPRYRRTPRDAQIKKPAPPKRPWSWWIEPAIEKAIAFGIGALGANLGWLQYTINTDFARSLGQSTEAANTFGSMGGMVDLASLVMLPASRIMRHRGLRSQANAAVMLWVLCWAISTFASASFASRNIDDGQARLQDAKETAEKIEREIEALEAERARFSSLQADHLGMNRLNAAKLDAAEVAARMQHIKDLRDRAKGLLKIGQTDPVAGFFNAVSFGLIKPEGTGLFRVFAYATIPSLGGALILFAFTIGMPATNRRENVRLKNENECNR